MQDLLDEAARRLLEARYVIALTGAGLSVESGIPPFRGPGGLWTKYGEPPMNGYERFLADPKQAWEDRLSPTGPLAELWRALGAARPNPGHEALVALEDMGILRATITQNVDDLHRQAGAGRLLEIHGNATLIRCIQCVSRFERDAIDYAVLPPTCPLCGGLLKSDTVSFGEPIPADVLTRCGEEAGLADCMLVAGTSATVYPAAGFPIAIAERGGDLIEVNPYESDLTSLCRVTLTGPSGEVLPALVDRVRSLRGW